jgi:GAF domain-containing protein
MLASILLLDPDGSHVRGGASPDLPEDYVRAMDGLPIGPRAGSCGTAAFTREPVIVGDIETDPLWSNYRAMALKHDLRACWSTPIFDSERRVLGTFGMYFRAPGLPNQRHLR